MSAKNFNIEQLVIDRSNDNDEERSYLGAVIIGLMVVVAISFSVPGVSDDKETTIVAPANSMVAVAQGEIIASASAFSANTQLSTIAHAAHGNLHGTAATVTNVLDASGHIVARRIATVSSQVTGKLNQLNIEEGQVVKKSDILAELDDQQARIGLQLAIAELQAKQANLAELAIRQRYERQRQQRNQELYKKQLISAQLLDDSTLNVARIGAQTSNQQALIALAEQQVAMAQYQLEQHKIRAPFDGVVISKNAQIGELISAGSSGGGFIRTGVGTIVDMSSLEIEVDVGESYINRVFVGQAVTATLDAYPQWHINSEVITVIPTADRQKASIRVRVKLLESDSRILPDMGVKVSFIG